MPARKESRLDSFSGSKDGYIQYLEAQLCGARQELVQLRPNSVIPTYNEPVIQQVPLFFVLETPVSQALEPLPAWKNALSQFINCIPKTEEEWAQRRKALRLDNEADIIYSIRVLTCSSFIGLPNFEARNTEKNGVTTLTIIEEYRKLTTTLGQHQKWAAQIFHFSTLLYICSCVVAIAEGDEEDAINKDMILFLQTIQGKCTAGKDYLHRLRKGALWVIDRAKELFSAGLGHRAWELFLLCGIHIHAYEKCTHHRDSRDFTRLVPMCKPSDTELQSHISFAIPLLIEIIGRGKWSLEVINRALGTKLRQDERDAWMKAVCNAQLSIRGPRDPMAEPITKRRRVQPASDATSSVPNLLLGVNQDRSLDGVNTACDSVTPCLYCEGQGHSSNLGHCIHALLSVVGLEIQDPMVSGDNSPGSGSRMAINSMPKTQETGRDRTYDTEQHDSNPDDSIDWDDLIDMSQTADDFVALACRRYFLDIPAKIWDLIRQANQSNLEDVPKSPLKLDYLLRNGIQVNLGSQAQRELNAKFKAHELKWLSELTNGVEEAIKEMDREIQQVAGRPDYDWESMLVLLEAGRVKAPDRALCSIIIPVKMIETDNNRRVQFDRDEKGTLIASIDWPVLATLPKDFCIRKVKCAIFFIWVVIFPKGSLLVSDTYQSEGAGTEVV